MAYYYDQLNYIHPFREGNGRTRQRSQCAQKWSLLPLYLHVHMQTPWHAKSLQGQPRQTP
ncbi:MAG: Fic family protein [Micrococcales bacterium]|nr:Fic family protein [Micrococcales bacterium]